MPKRIVVTEELAGKADAALAALSEKEPPRKKSKTPTEYVREHAAEIRALLKKGYTAADIVESLGSAGVSITSSTLQRALSSTAPVRKKRKTQAAQKDDESKAQHTTKKDAPKKRRTDTKDFVDTNIPDDL